jgi:D-glycero-alpha-D-manno-heptose-7-phosphate kinase
MESMHAMKKLSVTMKESLLKGDFGAFCECLNKSWEAKRNAADSITNPFIDGLHDFAIKNGAKAAKISGAGGGGFMMIYCDPCNKIKLMNALKEKRESGEKGGTVFTASFTEIGTQAWTIY